MHPARRSLFLSSHIDFDSLLRSEARISAAKRSENTREAYAYAWRAFSAWCEAAALSPLPAELRVVKNFATWCLEHGYRIATVLLRLTAIAHYHREAGLPSPIAKEVWLHIENAKRHFREEPGGKRAVTSEMLRQMMRRIPDNALGARDRAMILLGFAAGWRKSEITCLRFSDVAFMPQGLTLWLRASKTDQVAEGRLVGIQPGDDPLTCPVVALKAWLSRRGTWEGPLFLRLTSRHEITREQLGTRGKVIRMAVKKYIEAIGEDAQFFAAHSLRAGMITEAAKNGASEAAIMQRTGHKCSSTLRRYIRPASVFDFNPLKGVL